MIKKYFVFALIALCFIPLALTSAITSREGQNVVLSQTEPINDTVFLAGNNVTLNTDVVGDVFAFGQKININGNVDGDIIGAGQSITVNGNVSGSIRVAAQSVDIKGRVERSVAVASQDILLPESSFIGRDALLAGETININGTVAGSVNAASSVLNINGKVNKNVNYYSNAVASANTGLFLTSGALVSGDINYNAFGDVKGATQTNVLGSVAKNAPTVKQKNVAQDRVVSAIWSLITLLLAGLVIVLVLGKKAKDIEKVISGSVWKTFGIGFAVLICTPILGIIFLITAVGAYIGIILILVWVLMLLFAMFFAAIAFGQYLAKLIKKYSPQRFLINSLAGILVGYLLLLIPVVGFLVGLLGLCCGMGGMFLSFLESRKE